MKKSLRRSPVRILKRLAVIGAAFSVAVTGALAQRPVGVDVSHYDGSFSWTTVKNSGITFAWAKATEGTGNVDPFFSANVSGAKGVGIPISGYHFAHPESDTPASEAAHYWATAGPHILADGLTLSPMLDMEVFTGVTGATSYSDWVNQWCNIIVANAAGQGVRTKPSIYFSACASSHFNSSISQWGSDIANYNGQNPQTGTAWSACSSSNPWGGTTWNVWQFNDTGIEGDSDVFNGTAAGLTSTMIATSIHPPPDSYAGNDGNGIIETFLPDAINVIETQYQTTPNGNWTAWSAFGGVAYDLPPNVGYNADQRMQLFLRGTDNSVYSIWKTALNSTWNTWQNYGGNVRGTVTVGYLPTGAMQVFARSSSNTVVSLWQTGPNAGWTTSWTDMAGACFADPVAGANADGRMQLFCQTSTHTLQSNFKTTSGSWFGWTDYAGNVYGKPAVVNLPDGSMQVFVRTSSNTVASIYQTSPSGSWGSWVDLGGSCIADPVAGYNADGRIQLFVETSTHTVSSDYKTTTAVGAAWSGWSDHAGSCYSELTVAYNADGRMQLFMRDSNYVVWSQWQTNASGGWNTWQNYGGNTPAVSITTAPASQTVNVGQNAIFTVVSTNALTFQWRFNGANLSGATASLYTISNVQTNNAGAYSVVVANNGSSVTSTNAILTVSGGPPVITTQPAGQTVNQGQNASFSVVASGTSPLSYQWAFNGGAISGATSSSYTVVSAQPANAGAYSVTITNSVGTATSANATLGVNIPPAITTQPAGQTVNQGQNATFSVVATGTAPLTYQWTFNAANISGATASSYLVTSAQPANVGNYAVVINNVAGTVTSANAALAVNVPPSITTQPANLTVNQGQAATFSVVAAGTAPLSYQWMLNGANISGATASSYTDTNAQSSDAGTYAVAINNVAGSVTSANATLTVILPPVINVQPASQLASVSNNVTFTVGLSQGTSPAYQWKFNGANISGATSSSLALSSITWASAGTYSVAVTNAAGSATSANATLKVQQAAFTFTNGVEGYTVGILDRNQTNSANPSLTNPWWGPGSPNLMVFSNVGSVTPHSGTRMIGCVTNVKNSEEYLNLVYRLDAGSNYYGNILLDWWFYDPKGTGTGASNYSDYVALVNNAPVSPTNDFVTTSFTSFNQRMSLGANNATGFNVGVYQGRIVGSTGGFGSNGWFNTTTSRSVGWHHARIIVGIPTNNSGPVSMFIDNMTNATLTYSNSGVALGFNLLELDSSFGGTNTGGFFDEFTFRAANDPWIAQQPVSATNAVGSSPSFTTVAVGTGYQWQFNGSNLTGGTKSSYTVTNAQAVNAGTYTCNITGTNGVITTSAATLTVQ